MIDLMLGLMLGLILDFRLRMDLLAHDGTVLLDWTANRITGNHHYPRSSPLCPMPCVYVLRYVLPSFRLLLTCLAYAHQDLQLLPLRERSYQIQGDPTLQCLQSLRFGVSCADGRCDRDLGLNIPNEGLMLQLSYFASSGVWAQERSGV